MQGPFHPSLALFLVLISALSAAPIDFSLTTLDGKHVHLRDYRGKPVVLNFWATWCGPCKAEMPLLTEMEKTYGPRGVVFLGLSLDEKRTRAKIPAFLSQHGILFPVFVGFNGDDLAKVGLGEAIPATIFLDEHGVPFARVQGQIRAAEVNERLEWVLGPRRQSPPEPLVKHLP